MKEKCTKKAKTKQNTKKQKSKWQGGTEAIVKGEN